MSKTGLVKNNTQIQLELLAEETWALFNLIEVAKVKADGWLNPMLIESIMACAGTLADYARDLRTENIAENDDGPEDYFGFIESTLATAKSEWANHANIEGQMAHYKQARADAEGAYET